MTDAPGWDTGNGRAVRRAVRDKVFLEAAEHATRHTPRHLARCPACGTARTDAVGQWQTGCPICYLVWEEDFKLLCRPSDEPAR